MASELESLDRWEAGSSRNAFAGLCGRGSYGREASDLVPVRGGKLEDIGCIGGFVLRLAAGGRRALRASAGTQGGGPSLGSAHDRIKAGVRRSQ